MTSIITTYWRRKQFLTFDEALFFISTNYDTSHGIKIADKHIEPSIPLIVSYICQLSNHEMIQFMQSIHFFDRLLERFTTLSNSLLKFERRYTEVVISNGIKWIFLIEMKKINLNVTVIDQMKNIFIPVEQLSSDVSFEISIYAIVFGPNLINHSSSLQIKNAFSNLPSNCPFPIILMESHIYLKYKIIEIISQQYECVIPANKIMYHIDSDD